MAENSKIEWTHHTEDSWEAVRAARQRLFDLIDETKNLDWLLLTKRPELVEAIMYDISEGSYGTAWNLRDHLPNVWIGTTVENQEQADKRIPELLMINAKVRFLSVEPMLGPIDLNNIVLTKGEDPDGDDDDVIHSFADCSGESGIDWVIVGGESGPNARPMHPDWARSIRDQCQAAGVPFFMKQGSSANWSNFKNYDGFPADIQIREFPV